MHELSIALSIVELAQEELQRQRGRRVAAIHLKLGPLSGVVSQALLSSYELACEGTPLEGSRLVIDALPIEIECDRCGKVQPAISMQEMACRVCGTPSAKVVRGRELEVVAMEICDE